ncbi:putative quinol monooxygenase [Erythrobacter sp. THAF29]|uniref:putative quinol monooxygenase n=1 Tax=Erythrobacter sp. THAF29 TaxID=2587851 RepID=UPI001267D0CD|nr:putative quinol monooxygenase [Erythrobacter sp. THAF29]QFT77292.1 Antibiotic biosynthesis monooxygenase [Erythrobacter sp. THAF29]
MVIVLATAKLGEDALEAGREALTAMIEASRAEKGCVEYAYALDILDPTLLRITEKWVDDAALAAHFQTPHMAAFQKALAGLDVSIQQVLKFEADEGSPLM